MQTPHSGQERGAAGNKGHSEQAFYTATAAESQHFPTGYGKNDTRAAKLSDGRPNPSQYAGQPYSTTTAADIVRMVKDPPSVPKEKGQWFIASIYAEADARCHEAQRERGCFYWLPVDIDDNDLSIEAVDEILGEVVGDAARAIYSSRSASAEDKKWRVLIPLAEPVSGADFSDTQHAFFDALEAVSEGVMIP